MAALTSEECALIRQTASRLTIPSAFRRSFCTAHRPAVTRIFLAPRFATVVGDFVTAHTR
jgi:hypothetical protein